MKVNCNHCPLLYTKSIYGCFCKFGEVDFIKVNHEWTYVGTNCKLILIQTKDKLFIPKVLKEE